MTLYQTLLLLSVIFPLLIYSDYREKNKADLDPNIEFDLNTRNSNFLISFTPFIALFYTENFWLTLLHLIPLYLYFAILMFIANKKDWCPFFKADISIYGSSGLVVTIIAYFIWFHEGVLSTPDTEAKLIETKETAPVFWPFYVFVTLFVSAFFANTFQPKKNRSESNTAFIVLTIQAIGYPILALFTDYYWWSMLVGLIAYAVSILILLRPLPDSSRGGIGFVLSYIYMMIATGSILVYAFLF